MRSPRSQKIRTRGKRGGKGISVSAFITTATESAGVEGGGGKKKKKLKRKKKKGASLAKPSMLCWMVREGSPWGEEGDVAQHDSPVPLKERRGGKAQGGGKREKSHPSFSIFFLPLLKHFNTREGEGERRGRKRKGRGGVLSQGLVQPVTGGRGGKKVRREREGKKRYVWPGMYSVSSELSFSAAKKEEKVRRKEGGERHIWQDVFSEFSYAVHRRQKEEKKKMQEGGREGSDACQGLKHWPNLSRRKGGNEGKGGKSSSSPCGRPFSFQRGGKGEKREFPPSILLPKKRNGKRRTTTGFSYDITGGKKTKEKKGEKKGLPPRSLPSFHETLEKREGKGKEGA